jgi:peptidyl-tRNA hydrolase, PTH1 family
MWRPRRIAFGLGNPGSEYRGTRHNAGFEVLDALVASRPGALFGSAASLDGYDGPRGFSCARPVGSDFLLVKPETFMNRSGSVVGAVAAWSGLPPGELMIVYDELDLDLGVVRLRPHGGHGGHNGMRSIIEALGTNAFPRLRLGIGPAPTDAVRHVLGQFLPREREEFDVSIAQAVEALSEWLAGEDLDRLMTRYHSRWT